MTHQTENCCVKSDVVPVSMITSLSTGSEDQVINAARTQALNAVLCVNGAVSGKTPVSVADSVARVGQLIADLQTWAKLCSSSTEISFPSAPFEVRENPYGNLELFVESRGKPQCLATLHPVDVLDNGNKVDGPLTQTAFRLLRYAPLLLSAASEVLRHENGALGTAEDFAGDPEMRKLLAVVEHVEGSRSLEE